MTQVTDRITEGARVTHDQLPCLLRWGNEIMLIHSPAMQVAGVEETNYGEFDPGSG